MSILAAAEEAPNILVPPVAELVVGGIAFFVVFFALARVLLPRIKKTLEERADAIEGGLARAEEAQAEAAETLAKYKEQLAEARHEAAGLREKARQEGAVILKEMREEAQAESKRLTTQAHQQIEAERKQALASLRTEVGRLAVDLAGRVVGESLEDEARQRRTVDRFLEELEATAEDTQDARAAR
ncbi:MAG: F0F1 ATP synthase subunit B [Actinomycetota bacterium]|jgi:F-type H+-transporting ATPase subunit b|nr:F0F1 ATP synthase subunit B [Sporichthyaceae bacterium]MDQ3113717.1 F0F1 ATP synthase subunit B [Actinomycetota bacterium]MDQ3450906.1 F0F1 ATP synthase subunit B [Actinomycetota bacterium]